MKQFKGRVWKLGDNISTDLLMPAISMYGKVPREEIKGYCLKTTKPEFAREVKSGDIIIAGKNFGCGSSRPASRNLMELGVGSVVAESCSAIFFRNSIAMGFPIIISPGVTDIFNDGETAEVRIETGEVINITTGQRVNAEAYSEFLRQIIAYGGMVEMFRQDCSL
ncbi:3-isopropylmalate dehydratase small subunit [Metallumcola ferriviriculae]|uniref:3-isopropylmalate dehydratase small subunit n=1 Tax=Metallumcola ferriviriculae TaxID=3039180 RepID=A0AAU0UQR6_9FIRM|nr:3-isopropylmalate dehydratase small subunit [Desulfitibacteraceae bacterium MK1]